MGSHATSYRNKSTVVESSAGTRLSQHDPQPQQLQTRLTSILPSPYVHVNRIIDIPRQKRSKAKRSCDRCRKRRIRCNANTNQPCHGCKSIDVECHFRDNNNSNKGQSNQPTQGHIESFEDRVSRLENLIRGVQNKHSEDQQQQHQNDIPDDDHKEGEEHLGKGLAVGGTSTLNKHYHGDAEDSRVLTLRGVREVVPMNPTEEMMKHMNLLQINDFERTRYIGSSSGVHLLNQSIFDNNLIHRLVYDKPSTKSWVAQKINNDMTEHIIIKAEAREQPSSPSPSTSTPNGDGIRKVSHKKLMVLEDIPHLTDELVELLIHAYFTFIQPYLPILNKLSFLEQYYFQNPEPPDEYLLSVMCVVAIDFLYYQDDYVSGTNFHRETIDTIKHSLRDKAMKIMGIVYRRSRISTLQTLILMSAFVTLCDLGEEEDDSVHWLVTGTAIRMAQDLGLHRSSTHWNLPQREIEHRRRLWYALYIMDKWVAAELGRPIAIPEEGFDVELPSPYEIDSAYHPVTEKNEVKGPMLVYQAETCIREKRFEYGPFLSAISLTSILRQVLVLYVPKFQNHEERSIEDIVDSLDRQLHEWHNNIPSDIHFNIRHPSEPNGHGAILYILYHCIIILLHRPFVTDPVSASHSIHSIRSQNSCTTSALNIIDTVQIMMNAGTPCLPRSFLGFTVFQAAIIFILNAGSEDENVRRNGCRNLARCAAFYSSRGMRFRITRILTQLSKRYPDEDESNDISNSGGDMTISIKPNTLSNYRNDTSTSDNDSARDNKKQLYEVTIPMLSSTSAEALFASSLPREIALFNKLPNNRTLRPCFEDLKITIPPPGPLLPMSNNDIDNRKSSSILIRDTRTINTNIQQQHRSYHDQVQSILETGSTNTTNSKIYNNNNNNNNIGQQPIDNDVTMSSQQHTIPIDIIDGQTIVDPSSTSAGMPLDDIFRQQQMAIDSAMDLLPVHNLPQGIYWTQEEWDVFLQDLGYERPL
ncbi:hypothetical protein INT45_010476 [Circinella minor]|uniref:Zn(2)-C6 fungal-type domain-containing protein n=1 Tax=Circinella minor TaxID=1195481 RepID=A0A8H7S571_9FUNG|nr:hypothetical protein INT45_010476 [Circinella minor]